MTLNAIEMLTAKIGLWAVAIAAFLYVIHVMVPAYGWTRKLASTGVLVAILSLITSIVCRSVQAEFFALTNMYEALMICTIGFLSAFFVAERWFKISTLGWAVCLLGLIMLFYGGSLPTEITPLQAALRSYWRSIHVPPLLLSYGCFTLATFSSVAYLIATAKEPPGRGDGHLLATREGGLMSGGALSLGQMSMTQLYDEVSYRCIAVGFPLLMIGVILGAVWANEAWGNYWSWDPKESMSLVTLLGYGAYLHMRINGEHSRRTLAWVAVLGFFLVLMTFVGVNMWGFGSIHSYGSVKG